MSRLTIDFGIDLGTTNSVIAQKKGMGVEILKNNENLDFTPSAVYIDAKRKWVGSRAKQRIVDDPENAYGEFKLQMGTNTDYIFEKSKTRMKPEELSAEVLKSLRETARIRSGENIEAAVITVPAEFPQPAIQATDKAAKLAGLLQSPLVQEPVAAATAYDFKTTNDRLFWLVYDFGGGTFDAAIINVQDEMIQVVNHGGDNYLGGKLIDWAIVENILVPEIARVHHMPNLNRADPKYRSIIAKIKHEAEKAKIQLSTMNSVEIFIDLKHENGSDFTFEYELKRSQIEEQAEPFILRTVNTCKDILRQEHLSSKDIDRIILVGGPTSMPYLRDRLGDKEKGLGIQLDFSVDPMTVVAKGAAMFAGGQRLKKSTLSKPQSGTVNVELDYKPMGPDDRPFIGGQLEAEGIMEFSDYHIEFVNSTSRPPWRSGKIPVSRDGKFTAELWAQKGQQNQFDMDLTNGTGRMVKTNPKQFPYTIAMDTGDQILLHTIGVATAEGLIHPFFKKGTPLPARHREIFPCAFEIKPNSGSLPMVPIFEGENPKAIRNRQVGTLPLETSGLKRPIPLGAEIEVTIDVDESRIIRASAFIPVMDDEYEMKVDSSEYSNIDLDQVKSRIDSSKERLQELRNEAIELEVPEVKELLDQIESEQLVEEAEHSLETAKVDPDARQKARGLEQKIGNEIDRIESSIAWPKEVNAVKEMIDVFRNMIDEQGDDKARETFQKHVDAVNRAIENNNQEILEKRKNELTGYTIRFLEEKGIMPVILFQMLSQNQGQMSDSSQAEQLIQEGTRALQNENIDALRAINKKLQALMPVQATGGVISILGGAGK